MIAIIIMIIEHGNIAYANACKRRRRRATNSSEYIDLMKRRPWNHGLCVCVCVTHGTRFRVHWDQDSIKIPALSFSHARHIFAFACADQEKSKRAQVHGFRNKQLSRQIDFISFLWTQTKTTEEILFLNQ